MNDLLQEINRLQSEIDGLEQTAAEKRRQLAILRDMAMSLQNEKTLNYWRQMGERTTVAIQEEPR